LQPGDDLGYPIAAEEVSVFAQVFGEPGEYRVWLDMFEVERDGAPELQVFSHGPFVVHVRPGRFVDGVHMRLRQVPFPRPGIYEFRLRYEDDEPLAVERILLKE